MTAKPMIEEVRTMLRETVAPVRDTDQQQVILLTMIATLLGRAIDELFEIQKRLEP